MSSATTHKAVGRGRRPSLLVRCWLYIKAAHLRWNIDSAEAYMLACERDGIMDSVTLRYWRDHLAAERVELATLHARIDGRLP
jgi:hypothetical protein